MRRGQHFYELFAFLSLAGDTRAIVPLVQDMVQRPREENMDADMAMVSIVHHIGHDGLARRECLLGAELTLDASLDL